MMTYADLEQHIHQWAQVHADIQVMIVVVSRTRTEHLPMIFPTLI